MADEQSGTTAEAVHVVAQGETLAGIARRYGFLDFTTIWNAAGNKKLRERRSNPNVLLPGDEVVIPARRLKTFSAATAAEHTFKLKAPALKLRVCVRDPFGNPIANTAYMATLGEKKAKGTTDADGLVELTVRAEDKKVSIDVDGLVFDVSVGELDPVHSPTGTAARLRNLGYSHVGDDDSDESRDALTFALMLFADENGIDTGPGSDGAYEDVLTALKKAHGS